MADHLFYGLATLLVTLSLLAVSLPNLLHGAIALIGSFFATAALYILLRMEFVALAQIMLYIGGIVIFMLIIILLTTGLGVENRLPVAPGRRLTGVAVSGVLLAGLLWAANKPSGVLEAASHRARPVTMDHIGLRLLSATGEGALIPFELISLLLLAALVGAVVIARRDPEKEERP